MHAYRNGSKELHTSGPAEVGATVCHVQVDRASVVVVLQDLEQLAQELAEVGVGHLLAPT